MIEVKDLTVGYGKKEILQGISAAFPDGKLSVILGPNGCGKTTLLKTAAGLIVPTEGTVLLSGRDSAAMSGRERAKAVALMPQLRHTPSMSVEELLFCARYPYLGFGRSPRAEDKAAVEEAMERCGITAFRARQLRTLSGGERQRVYFAMALAQGTSNLLLDEPTTYLDPETQFEIFELAKAAAGSGKCVVLVTHDLPFALRYADCLTVLTGGSVAASGSAAELCECGVFPEVFRVDVVPVTLPEGKEYVVRRR